jgi:hypothetical protein
MNKKAITPKTNAPARKPAGVKSKATSTAKVDSLALLLTEVRELIQSARRGVSSVIDTFQVLTNFEIGRRIVEHEQHGEMRATYGQEMLKALSIRLSEEFGRGFSVTNLQLMRKFYIENKARIQQTPAVELAPMVVLPTSARSAPVTIQQQPTATSSNPFTLKELLEAKLLEWTSAEATA